MREQISELHPNAVVELRASDIAEALREVQAIAEERDRWATRMRSLERRLHDVVAVASGVRL